MTYDRQTRLAIILAAITLLLIGTQIAKGRDTALVNAIIQVESRGNNFAVGDGGRAVGCLQIWPITVADANRISGRHYTLSDRYDRRKSIEIFWIVTDFYSRGESRQVIARRWNGGPQGEHIFKTLPYWWRVQDALSTGRAK